MNAPNVTNDSDRAGLLASFRHVPGGLMPALHAIQHGAGYIDRGLIPSLAETFNLTDAEVHGVISFYKDFRTEAPRGPIVQVCRAEACQSRGASAVWDQARTLGSFGTVEVEEVFCLGNCALGPTIAIDGQMHANVVPTEVAVLIRNSGSPRPTPVASAAPSIETVTVYVPLDAVAVAVGADEVAAGLAATAGVAVVRNGSRGMLWLEPMIEVETPKGRVAYGPVTSADVPSLLAADVLNGGDHPLRLGFTEQLPWMARQNRVTFRRVGIVDPRSAESYLGNGGIVGLDRALAMTPSEVVDEIGTSGLRGRGGAAFPAGIKLRTVHDAPGAVKYIVCNADEGDSGTFADRMLLEGDPFMLLEGMAIAAWAVQASEGYIYIRSEYPAAISAMQAAIETARERGWLGASLLRSGFAFDVHVRVGAGAYICGEETALLESLEGRRGVVRAKPPLPAIEGLWGKPTVVNNVLTLATMTAILADGAASYAGLGVGRSRGTQVMQLAGNIARGGILEVPFGISVNEVLNEFGGGTSSGRPIRAVQAGGPLGSYLPVEQFDLAVDYEAFAAVGALLGHGGMVVFDDTVDMAAQARFAMEFCAVESCGKCTPCRIGSTRGVELIDKIVAGDRRDENLATLVDLCDVMTDASLCAMGGLTPLPVKSALTHFSEDFERPIPIAPSTQAAGVR
jgi:formate dehydrogenase iron-sulfur subunit